MVARTWVGGGLNLATNPANWSPAGVPALGDTLTMSNGTMNVDLVALDTTGALTVNGAATINMVAANMGPINTGFDGNTLTVNMRGRVSTNINQGGGVVTVNVTGAWYGIIDQSSIPGGGHLTVNGGVFVNSGTSLIGPDGATATINSVVLGDGAFTVTNYRLGAGVLEFANAVADGQTVTVGTGQFGQAELIINNVSTFLGRVVLQGNPTSTGEISIVRINNLVGVDSYSFEGDVMLLWESNRVVDMLPLSCATPFKVVKTGVSAIATYVGAGTPPTGTPLPSHF
jgi:hypothetical protein